LHGIRTEDQIRLEHLGAPVSDRVDYAPSGWLLLRRALPRHEVSEDDVLLDAGAGMGRIVLQAAVNYPFRRVIGVEMVDSLQRIAADNLARHRHRWRSQDATVVHSDITDYLVPDDVTIVYLYNPFTGSVFDTFVRHLQESLDRNPRTLRIIYANPVEEDRLLATGLVRPLRSVRARCRTKVYLMTAPTTGHTSRKLQSVSDATQRGDLGHDTG